MSIRTNAKTIGKNDATSSEKAAAIRAAFNKASAERKAEIMADFKVGYIAGREKVSLAEAQAIFEAGKGKGATKAGIMAIDRATSGWNYHVIKAKGQAQQPQSHSRVPTQLREAAMVFLAEFEGETLTAQITAAIAVLNKMR